MHSTATRREFLQKSSAAVAGFGLASLAGLRSAAAQQDQNEKKAPAFRISLAEWSLHKALQSGKMDNLEFAAFAKGEGIEGIEYVNQFFMDKAEDKKYLQDMNARAADVGVKNLLIMIDREGDLGDPDEKKRTEAVEKHYKWVNAAKALGCHSIRVNARSKGPFEEQTKLAVDGLRRLSEFAAKADLNVIVENHGGLSSNGKWLAGVIKEVNLPNCGTLPDFGNFRVAPGDEYDRYQGVEELMPFAKAVSAKTYAFDDEGNETTIDYFRMMKIVVDHGYHGYVGIEYEGSKLPEPEGIRASKKLLERVLESMG